MFENHILREISFFSLEKSIVKQNLIFYIF